MDDNKISQDRDFPKVLFFFIKYSDYIEAYSELIKHKDYLDIILLDKGRNNQTSMDIFISILPNIKHIEVHTFFDFDVAIESLKLKAKSLQKGDVLIAPFIRYRSIWKILSLVRNKDIKTVHLSEPLPDSFGLLGYRLGFCNPKNSRYYYLSILPMVIYAFFHRPDFCYFPCMPNLPNPFVCKSLEPLKPPLPKAKEKLLRQLLGSEHRPLVIAGFGYDAIKMAESRGWDKFIATSKNKEIIIDGVYHPTPFFVTAEDILLFDSPTELLSYTSSAVVWARRWYPDLKIDCYHASKLNQQYGFLCTRLIRRTLAKLKIKVLAEDPYLLSI